jgi:hypothetical protein
MNRSNSSSCSDYNKNDNNIRGIAGLQLEEQLLLLLLLVYLRPMAKVLA